MGKLEESNEELKETQKVAHIGSWHLDIATDEITWSDELYRMYGLDPAEPPPRLLDSSHLFTVDSWDKLSSAIVKTAKGGIPYELELETLRKNGSHGWMWAHGNSVKDANGNIVGLRGAVQDITERKLAEERILALLGEKELILKEVHHRVKNNLNVLGSLLSLHAQTVEEQSARTALEEAKGRIQSMSLLYDKLYRSPDFTELSIKEFLSDMIDEIVANFPNSTMVKVEKDIQDFIVDAKRLQSLGIVINELLTNVMKHAFKGRENGSIAIFATVVDGTMAISVQDDGNGIPEHVSFENSNGFGLQLIQVLTRQLEGKIRVERGKGTKVVLELEANVR
jgi:PAS domain S-box-containing protein